MESVPVELMFEALGRKDFELFLARRANAASTKQLQATLSQNAELQRRMDRLMELAVPLPDEPTEPTDE